MSNRTPMPSIKEEMSISDVAKVLACSPRSVYPYSTIGRVGASGVRVKLERWINASGAWVSSMAAIELFRTRLNDPLYAGPESEQSTSECSSHQGSNLETSLHS